MHSRSSELVAAADSPDTAIITLDRDGAAVAATSVDLRAGHADTARSDGDRRRRDVSATSTSARRAAVPEAVFRAYLGRARNVPAAAVASASAHRGVRRAGDRKADRKGGKSQKKSLAHHRFLSLVASLRASAIAGWLSAARTRHSNL